MKKLLFRKLIIDCVKFFLISLLSASIIVWVFQAVNFLDIMIEDGRDHLVYIKYTLFNFPKTLNKLIPFALFFSFSYVFAKYELNNELLVFWTHGINKIQIVNLFLKFSIFLVILQIILTSFIVPKSLELSRNFLKQSNVNFFDNFIKPKKFNDTIKNLTIYAESKTENGDLKNIYMKKGSFGDFQITYAKTGKYNSIDGVRFLTLYNGTTIYNVNNNISNFAFSKSDFNLSDLDSNAITVTKTQETSTTNLVYCAKKFLQSDMQKLKPIMLENCNSKNMDNIFKELYKRHIIPFYLPVLILISLIHIIRSKEKINFGRFRIVIFICGLLVIIFSETTLRFINDSVIYNLNFVVVPIFLLLVLYLFILFDLRINFKEKRL
tara:strand:- start:3202 stop:4341 length:1140 start_codon:yes stop_codon:yes gene_type:complete